MGMGNGRRPSSKPAAGAAKHVATSLPKPSSMESAA
jgi:hypothetical protein